MYPRVAVKKTRHKFCCCCLQYFVLLILFVIFSFEWPSIGTYRNIGTKIDLRDDRETLSALSEQGLSPLKREQGQKLANKIRAVKYMECSALTQRGLKQVRPLTSILTHAHNRFFTQIYFVVILMTFTGAHPVLLISIDAEWLLIYHTMYFNCFFFSGIRWSCTSCIETGTNETASTKVYRNVKSYCTIQNNNSMHIHTFTQTRLTQSEWRAKKNNKNKK